MTETNTLYPASLVFPLQKKKMTPKTLHPLPASSAVPAILSTKLDLSPEHAMYPVVLSLAVPHSDSLRRFQLECVEDANNERVIGDPEPCDASFSAPQLKIALKKHEHGNIEMWCFGEERLLKEVVKKLQARCDDLEMLQISSGMDTDTSGDSEVVS